MSNRNGLTAEATIQPIRPVTRVPPPISTAASSWGATLAASWPLVFAAFAISLELSALFVGYRLSGPIAISSYHVARQVITLWYVGLYLSIAAVGGLYRRMYTSSGRSQFRRCLKAHGVAIAVLSGPFLFLFGLDRTAMLLATLSLIFIPALLMTRLLTLVTRFGLLSGGWFLERAVLILDETEGRVTPTWVGDIRHVGYDVAGVIHADSRMGVNVADLHAELARTGARFIVVPSPRYVNSAFDAVIRLARAHGLTIRIYSPKVQRILSAAKVDDAAGVTIEAPVRRRAVAMQQIIKRIFDLVVASLALLVLAPFMALVAIAIRLESRGPLLFRQPRASSPGRREFTLYKFRSMSEDSDVQRRHLASANEAGGLLFKMQRDPRITRIGRVIRKLSIDELPQLLNVIKGEMSMVGPRPLPTDDFSFAVGSEIDGCYHRRAWVKAGLTGLWQVSGRSETGFVEMVMLDLYYAEHGSIFLDLYILLNTIPTVLLARGAY
jgi:exopolysaccharide biosynthesis polyprenyl glycosylphosphotransferase